MIYVYYERFNNDLEFEVESVAI